MKPRVYKVRNSSDRSMMDSVQVALSFPSKQPGPGGCTVATNMPGRDLLL